MSNPKINNRRMILPIPHEEMLQLIAPIGDKNLIYKLKLPKDVTVISVHYDFYTQQWLILLESEEFGIVLENMKIPQLQFSRKIISKSKIVEYELPSKNPFEGLPVFYSLDGSSVLKPEDPQVGVIKDCKMKDEKIE